MQPLIHRPHRHTPCLMALTLCCLAASPAAGRTIVAFGDSTTAPRTGQMVYTELLQAELPTDSVVNVGLLNHTTEQARAVFADKVLSRKPDVVIVQFGINDAAVDVWMKKPAMKPRVDVTRYEANLRYFVETLKSRGVAVVLMTPNRLCWTAKTRERFGKPPYNPADPDGLNVLLKDYAGVVRKVARDEKVPLVDVYAAYEARDRKPGQARADLLPDGVHPSEAGHRLVAGLLLPALRPATR